MQPVIVLLLCAWAIGIALGGIPESFSLLGAIAGVGMALAWWLRYSWATVTAVGLLLGLGVIYANTSVGQPEQVGCSLLDVTVGRVAQRPAIRQTNVRYLIEDERGCRFMVYADRWPVWGEGDVVRVSAGKRQLVTQVAAENEGYGQYLARYGVSAVINYPHVELVSAEGRSNRMYTFLNERIGQVFVEPDAGLVRAMLLGDQSQLPDDFVERWRVSGISHAISISGLHISLLTGMLIIILQPLPLAPRWRLLLSLTLLWAYVCLAGAPISAARAGIFWSLALLAFRLGWLVSLPTALLMALVIFPTLDPTILRDVSWQLSLSGVTGIFLMLFLMKRLFMGELSGWRGILTPIAVSLGASLTTWPLVAYYFGIVSPVAILTNLLIVPAVPLFLVGSMASVATTFVVPSVGLLLAYGVHGLVWWMDAAAAWGAALPGAWFSLTVGLPFLAVYYVLLGLLVCAVLYYQGRSWREVWE